jgi:hypothetical protein
MVVSIRRGPHPVPSTAKLSCQRVDIPGAATGVGIEVEGAGYHVNRWDEVWSYGGTKIGVFSNYIWIAGQAITDLRFCVTPARPIICGSSVILKSTDPSVDIPDWLSPSPP